MTDRFLASSKTERSEYFAANQSLLRQLATSYSGPEALLITCSDARVMPEKLLAAEPGQYLTFRNIANMVPPYWQVELSVASVLEFAVLDMGVNDIIVCGHTDCGGIKNLVDQPDLSTHPGLSRWLSQASTLLSANRMKEGDPDLGAYLDKLVERNVVNQLRNLASYPFIAEMMAKGKVTLHGWIYDIEASEIRWFDQANDVFVPA